MILWDVEIDCPSCGKVWIETRVKKPKRAVKKKCPECKGTPEITPNITIENGCSQDKGCFNCKFFKSNKELHTNQYYKECLKGYKSKVDEQLLSDIVYYQDICEEWEGRDD
ncbi:MAG: hypothetical protein CL489_16630 [Acidobacteria bacterium]|nr:hypothetical protein [Acidobacteriota bacterium]|tara:strand:+ start:4005 stop:4337 length:333 start_codon:yes stop_codon:yes gene_type:complete